MGQTDHPDQEHADPRTCARSSRSPHEIKMAEVRRHVEEPPPRVETTIPKIPATAANGLRPPDRSTLTFGQPPRRRNKAHLKFVATQPCLLCNRQPSDAHHLKFAQPMALGRKVSDEFTVPLCRTHHRQLHEQATKNDGGRRWLLGSIPSRSPETSGSNPTVNRQPFEIDAYRTMPSISRDGRSREASRAAQMLDACNTQTAAW